MFTALFVTRWIINALYAIGFKDAKWYGVAKEKKSVNFLGKRGIFFTVSAALIIAGFVVMGVHSAKGEDALNYSLEFKGGTAVTVDFNESWTLEELTSQIVPKIEDITGSAVQIQTVQGSNEVIFKTNSLDVETREELTDMLVADYNVDAAKITSETISSTISDEMKSDTIIAVIVAIVCMLIYIRIRFRDIRFGISSIVCLLHDVLIVLAFYAAARVSVSNTFIACMLTIVGYSINATIVIFDRIRENMASASAKTELIEIINKSISQTLSRSIFTSLTTFIMVAAIYVLGVTSIRDFALPLMVGIVCGAYSSVCLAGALWYTLRTKFPGKKTAGAK
jgi:SecD/SecF fusion protein